MPKAATKAAPEKKPAPFKRRISVRLDDDVINLGNDVLGRVDFTSRDHAVNAALRRAYAPIKSDAVQVRIDPFEQAVFEGHLIVKRLRKKVGK